MTAPAVAYVRVSSGDQDLAGQRRDVVDYCLRRGWGDPVVYEEKVTATGRVLREEHDRLLRDLREGRLPGTEHVVVWSLDRWSRDPRFTVAVGSIEAIEALGVRWHSFKEPQLDSSEDGTPNLARDLLRGILPTIAAFESRRKSERVRVAMRELKEGQRQTRSGKPVGRPRRVTPELVGRAEVLRRRGLPWSRVAQLVGLPAETCRRAVYAAKRAAGAV